MNRKHKAKTAGVTATPLQLQRRRRMNPVSEYQIKTVESRRFDITGAVSPIEVEFHKEPRWAAELEGMSIAWLEPPDDGLPLARISARIALTGSALPPMCITGGGERPVPLTTPDLLDLAFLIASFEGMPTEVDYSNGSRYLALRAAIENRLDLKNIHLELRGGRRQIELEKAIEQIAPRLAAHSLAFSQSPELSFGPWVELIKKGGRVFAFSTGADKLLGTTALASAYQLAVLSNPVIAVQLAMGGASAYVVLKFGAAVGKKVEQLVHKW